MNDFIKRALTTVGECPVRVANLDKVPEVGALVAIGLPKLQGGTGGYARFIAICPPSWKYGVTVGEVPEAPTRMYEKPLRWDPKAGVRVR